MNLVKELRINKGILQKDLADAIGVSGATISFWESQKKDPNGKHLKKLAEYFGVDPLFILGYGNEKPAFFIPDEKSAKTQTEQIVEYVLEKLNGQDQTATDIKTPEARLIATGVDKMPQEQREQALNLIRAVFTKYADYFTKGTETNDT